MTGNYRHSYHAGNSADVLKHVVLLQLLQAMQRKDKPLLYVDTHAGRGQYDLQQAQSAATEEWKDGVERLVGWENPPSEVQCLFDELHQLNRERGQTYWRYYPGSPWLVARHLRAQDRAILCEIQSDECKLLQKAVEPYRNAHVEQGDGYQRLRSLLPPIEKRALVLIDPPYESNADSWSSLVNILKESHKRFATGVYAVWYPIKGQEESVRFHRLLKQSGIKDISVVELTVFDEVSNVGLNGSGVVVLNAPFQFREKMQACLPKLWQKLSANGKGRCAVNVLVPE